MKLRQPTSRHETRSRRKCCPSTCSSIVNTIFPPGGALKTAASSPMPSSMPARAPDRAKTRASRAMRAFSSDMRFAKDYAGRAGSATGASFCWGRDTMNAVPRGTLSSMRTVPAWAWTRRRTMERPSPVPPYCRVLDESTW